MKKKVFLTPLQEKVFELYVKKQLTQEQIAIEIYGSKYRQGCVCKILKAVSRKINYPLGKVYRKSNKYKEVELEFGL